MGANSGTRRQGKCIAPQPEDWSARLCQLAERAAQRIPLFRKSDREYSGTDRGIQVSEPKRYRYVRLGGADH